MAEINVTIKTRTPFGYDILYPKTTPQQAGAYPVESAVLLEARIKEVEDILNHLPTIASAAWLGYASLGAAYLTNN
jgi:hypothetical protein